MIDLVEYLESKDCKIINAGAENIHTHCFFCGESTDRPGRLYINVNEESEKFGLSYCHLCNHSTNLNGLRRHFGDSLIDDYQEVDGEASPIIEAATEFYHKCLLDNVEAFEFLVEERGFTEQTIISARLGWAPGGSELHSHLLSQFTPEEIVASELTNRFSQDYFKHEIIIPYLDYGRAYNMRGKKIGGKYRGIPKRPVSLYGTDSVIGEKTVLITEGEFCSLHLQQLGFPSVGVPGSQTWKEEWDEKLEEAMRTYIVFDADKAGKAGAEKLSTKLGPKSRVVEIPKKGFDIEDYIVKLGKNKEDVDFLLSKSKGGNLVTVREAYNRWMEVEGNPGRHGLKFNIDALDLNMNHGLLPGQLITLIAMTGQGKSQPIDTLIPTPDGPRLMGNLEVGDQVFGSDGKPVDVVGVFDRGIMDTYRVRFSDKTFLDVGLDHIWSVSRRTGKESKFAYWENKTTSELIGDLKRRREFKWIIPMAAPVEYEERDYEIGPYTMGAMLANGNTTGTSARLTTPDADVAERCGGEGHDLPRSYLEGSIEQRVALLQGLLDGDGSTRAGADRRSMSYFTSSPNLAQDIVELVNSLGGTAVRSPWRDRSDEEGRENHLPECRISIMLPDHIRFSSERKSLEVKSKYVRVPRRAIVDIELIGEDEHRCIKVGSADSLYLGSFNYVVTHNSAFIVNMMHRMKMVQPDIKVMVLSLEQTRNEFFDRMHKLHAFYDPTVQAIDTVNFWQDNMMLIDKNSISEREVEDSVYQFIYETGEEPDIIIVDYLGYYARGCRGVSEYDRTTNAIMDLKALAKDLQLVIFTPHQANRTGEFGGELAADQAKSSGAVENTSDVMITMWAPDAAKHVKDEDKNGEVFQRIVKNRNGPANMLVKYQWAPLSMAMVPLNDINYLQHAVRERKYAAAGDTREEALKRRLSGSLTI